MTYTKFGHNLYNRTLYKLCIRVYIEMASLIFFFERSSPSLFWHGLFEGCVQFSARWFVDAADLCQTMPAYPTAFFYGVCSFIARHAITSCSLCLLSKYPLIAPLYPTLPVITTVLACYVMAGIYQKVGKQVGEYYVHVVNTPWILYKANYLPLSIALISHSLFLRFLMHLAYSHKSNTPLPAGSSPSR